VEDCGAGGATLRASSIGQPQSERGRAPRQSRACGAAHGVEDFGAGGATPQRAATASQIGIGGRRAFLAAPPATPPDKRVRIRRFGQLRSFEPRQSQLVEETEGHRGVQKHLRVVPPPTTICGHAESAVVVKTQTTKLVVDRDPALQLLEPDRA
jgi:hypothetical protein